MKKNLALLAATLVLMIIFSELLLRFFPIIDPYAVLKTDEQSHIPSQFAINLSLTFSTEPGLPGCSGDTTGFTINNMGFRGDSLLVPKPQNEFRIFVIGGSTAECLFLDDRDAWPAVLQHELQTVSQKEIKVYNAGKSGDASPDHVAILSHRIVHLQPDMVIMLCGINDLTKCLSKYDYLHFPKDPDHDRWGTGHWAKLFLTEFQLGRRAYFAIKKIEPWSTFNQETITTTSNYSSGAELQKEATYSDSIPSVDLQSYSENLSSIAGITNALGVSLIFMHQQSTWNNPADSIINQWHWLNYRDGVRYKESVMDSLLNEYNRAMDVVAVKNNVGVFRTDEILPKTHEYFYDDCHFNPHGAKFLAERFAEFVIGYIPRHK